MPLPSFSVTGNLNDIPGANLAGELVTTALTPATLRFTDNTRAPHIVLWDGELYRLPRTVTVYVSDDGSISDEDNPVLLVANDDGLNVTGLQYTVEIVVNNSVVASWPFDAPEDGGTVDLGTVAHAPGVTAAGVVGVSEAQLLALIEDSGSDVHDAIVALGAGFFNLPATTHAATGKSTPVDADELALVDSAASNGLKKLTWANLKATIKSYYDSVSASPTNKNLSSGTNTFPTFNQNTTGSAATLTTPRNIDGQAFNGSAAITVIAPGTHAATGKTTPVAADEFPLVDSAASNVLKKLTWANLMATVKADLPFKIVAPSGDTTGATDSAAITAAIGSGKVVVFLLPGIFYVNASIVLKNRTQLQGAGMFATEIRLANGVNASVIKNFVSPDGIVANAQFCKIRDLSIDGNKANQSAGHGIQIDCNPQGAKATNDDEFDSHQTVENVRIANCKQDGFNGLGRSSMVLNNVYAVACDRNNFLPSFDSVLTNCVSSLSGYEGFLIHADSVQLTGCKSFYSGQVSASDGIGFHVTNGTGDILAGCHAQDNNAHGYAILSARSITMAGCVADSNSTSSAGTYFGLDVWDSQGCLIDLACVERRANGVNSYQTGAIQVRSSSVSNSFNVTHVAVGGATIGAAVVSGSVLTGNHVVVNGQVVARIASVTSSATPTINTDTTDQFNITLLAAAITSMTTNLSGTPYDGQLLDIRIKGDATPRTITWGASFTGTLLSTTAASKTHLQRLKWDAAAAKWAGYLADGTGY